MGVGRRISGRSVWVLLMAFGALLGPAGCSKEDSQALAARQAIEQGRWEQARPLVEGWAKREPRSVDAQLAVARVAYAQARAGDAYEAIKAAKALNAPAGAVERLEGLILAKAGESARAEPLLNAAHERSGRTDVEVMEALSRVLLNTYKFQTARELLNHWVKVSPGGAKPYLWLAEIDRRTDTLPDEAVAHYKAALERDPSLVEARLGLAEVLWAAKRSSEASEEFAAYLKAKPDDAKGHLGAARAAKDLGDDASVESHLRSSLELAPDDPMALKELGSLHQRRNKPAEALAALDRAYKVDRYDAEVLYQRGLLLARLGRGPEAVQAQREAAKLRDDQAKLLEVQNKLLKDPNNPELRGRVARWMFEHGQADEAARWARMILERKPGDPAMNGLLAEYHEGRGEPGLANSYRLRAGGP